MEYVGTSKLTDRWRKVIAAVRAVYKGKITYSAAFAEWKDVQFWDDLDVISISAYFPVATVDRATKAELRAGWATVYRDLEGLHRKTGKRILFSELGYTPAPKAGREPWSYDIDEVDKTYQALLFHVALEEAAKRPFIDGVFLWKWFSAPLTGQRLGREPFATQPRPQLIETLKQQWSPAK